MDNYELIEVFVINYNGENIILSTIQSLLDSVGVKLSITIVDDASTDNSIQLVKEHYPFISIYQMPNNQKHANILRNKALELARAKYIFITDNDLLFDKHCLSELYNFIIKDENIAACTPRLMYLNEPDKIYVAGTRIHYIGAAISEKREQFYNPTEDEPSINSGTGICLINRDIAIEYGGFDTNLLQGWGSDGEFYQRLLLAGYKCYYVPKAFALHEAKLNVFERKYRVIGQTHNRWMFILSHYSVSLIILILPVLVLYEIIEFLFIIMKGLAVQYLKGNYLLLKNFRYLIKKRKFVQSIRKVPDKEVLFSGPIYIAPVLVKKFAIANSVLNLFSSFLNTYWKLIKKII